MKEAIRTVFPLDDRRAGPSTPDRGRRISWEPHLDLYG
jgi:hypothetical protein